MSDSVWPHRRQSTRLPRPWGSPGKNTGVGCHFLLQCIKVKSESEVTQSCLTLSDPMDCSLPGSSEHGIFPGKSTGVGCHCLLLIKMRGMLKDPWRSGPKYSLAPMAPGVLIRLYVTTILALFWPIHWNVPCSSLPQSYLMSCLYSWSSPVPALLPTQTSVETSLPQSFVTCAIAQHLSLHHSSYFWMLSITHSHFIFSFGRKQVCLSYFIYVAVLSLVLGIQYVLNKHM